MCWVVMVMMGMSLIRTLQTRCIPARDAASIFLSDSCFMKTRWIQPGSLRSRIRATLRREYPVPYRSFSTPDRCWIGITPAQLHERRLTAAPVRRRQPMWELLARRYPERRSQELVVSAVPGTRGPNFPPPIQNQNIFPPAPRGFLITRPFPPPTNHTPLGDFSASTRA